MIKTLIVTGGNIEQICFNEICLNNNFDYIIASDGGLQALDKFGVMPNYIIGDFDSINKKTLDKYVSNKNIEIIRLNPEKDYTDTHMAVKLAMKLKSTDIIIIGGTGTRIDHLLANIHILKEGLDKDIKCKIIDSRNEIQLINKSIIIEKDEKYKYISLIPLTTEVNGITLKGLKYPLSDATLKIGHSIGVSNEQIDEKVVVNIKEGILILIRSKD